MTDHDDLIRRARKLMDDQDASLFDMSEMVEALMHALEAASRNERRWKFCDENGYPKYLHPSTATHSFCDPSVSMNNARDGYWIITIDKTQQSFRGATAAEAIDAAIASETRSGEKAE